MLEAYSEPNFSESSVQELVAKYLELRVKECMLSNGLREKALGHNGHIYLQLLKEKVMKELGVDQPSLEEDLQYSNLISEFGTSPRETELVVEGKYNTATVNNLDALGYDNFEERLES